MPEPDWAKVWTSGLVQAASAKTIRMYLVMASYLVSGIMMTGALPFLVYGNIRNVVFG